MTAIFAVTFVMSAVLICKWTLSHYDDDDDDDKDNQGARTKGKDNINDNYNINNSNNNSEMHMKTTQMVVNHFTISLAKTFMYLLLQDQLPQRRKHCSD